ncbi:DNA binding protein [Streptomyces phage VieEnRose]|nr:DNA binding protein [Streptomyces phage VieEnRose]
MKIEVTVCNVCQVVDRPTAHYTITRNGAATEVDLCSEHSAPLDELFPAPAPTPVKRATPARKAPAKKAAAPRRRGAKVVSLDEIERMKQG